MIRYRSATDRNPSTPGSCAVTHTQGNAFIACTRIANGHTFGGSGCAISKGNCTIALRFRVRANRHAVCCVGIRRSVCTECNRIRRIGKRLPGSVVSVSCIGSANRDGPCRRCVGRITHRNAVNTLRIGHVALCDRIIPDGSTLAANGNCRIASCERSNTQGKRADA